MHLSDPNKFNVFSEFDSALLLRATSTWEAYIGKIFYTILAIILIVLFEEYILKEAVLIVYCGILLTTQIQVIEVYKDYFKIITYGIAYKGFLSEEKFYFGQISDWKFTLGSIRWGELGFSLLMTSFNRVDPRNKFYDPCVIYFDYSDKNDDYNLKKSLYISTEKMEQLNLIINEKLEEIELSRDNSFTTTFRQE